jgi:site-specific recombinase XerD
MMEVAKHYLLQRNGSTSALFTQISAMFHFCKWMNKDPESLIEECKKKLADKNSELYVQNLRNRVDEYIFILKNRKLSPTSINKSLYSIRIFFRINDIYLKINFKVQRRALYSCRSITMDELQKILSIANLREKVIVGILAVSGIRTGTLVKLKYRHVKHDLENGITPLHLSIDSQITKCGIGYSTFLNAEVAEFLKQYLDERRKGSKRINPEIIDDESPLIKIMYHTGKADPLTTQEVGYLLRKLFFKSGVLTKKPKTNAFGYEVGANSFRKFFRT